MLMRTARFSLAIILALLAWSAPAAAQTKVKFVLDWQVQGPQAPVITAKATGGFTAQGLDLTIDRGTGSQQTIEEGATGTYDMGYGAANSMIEDNLKKPQTPRVA